MQRAAGSLQNSWRNDGCGSRFGGRLFPGLSIMKSETLQEFKQFLAEEWGIGVEEISDKQVLALYFSLQLSGKRLIAEGVVIVVVGAVVVLSLLVMRSVLPSTPGRLRRTRQVMFEVARLNTGRANDLGTISPRDAQQFSQLEWKSLVSRMLLAAAIVNVAGRLLGTNMLADVLTLLLAGVIGVLAGWKLIPH